MTQELFYTSAPQGLRPGSRGFCTVMSTSGMAKNLADRLEALSGYRHVFAANDPNAKLNPTVHSHLRVTVGGKPFHILSRISAAGLDYTQRSNKFAHHVVLEQKELVPAGPAALLAAPGFMVSSWEGEPRVIGAGRRPPAVEATPAPCRYWQRVAGDAGWAGVLAETATAGSSRIAAVIYKPGTDTLRLVCEAMALLPPALRWQVTFSTYYTKLPPEIECQWRFVLAGSPEAKAVERSHQLVVDLAAGAQAPDGDWPQAASTGKVPIATLRPPHVHSGEPRVNANPIERRGSVLDLSAEEFILQESLEVSGHPGMPAIPIDRLIRPKRQRKLAVVLVTSVALVSFLVGAVILFTPLNSSRELSGVGNATQLDERPSSESISENEQTSQTGSASTANPGTAGKAETNPAGKPVDKVKNNPAELELTLEDAIKKAMEGRRQAQSKPVSTPTNTARPSHHAASITTLDLTPIKLPDPPSGGFQDPRLSTVNFDIPNFPGESDNLVLLGGRSIHKDWLLEAQRAGDPGNNSGASGDFQILLRSKTSKVASSLPIAHVHLAAKDASIKWLKMGASSRSLAGELRNCAFRIESSNFAAHLPLRVSESIDPVPVAFGFAKSSVPLPIGKSWPRRPLELGILAEHSLAGYQIDKSSADRVTLRPTDPNWPLFTLTLSEKEQRVSLSYEWKLIGPPADTPLNLRARLESISAKMNANREKYGRINLQLQSLTGNEKKNVANREEIASKRRQMQELESANIEAEKEYQPMNAVVQAGIDRAQVRFIIFMYVESCRVILATASRESQ